jgi:hypothetical protein
MHVVLDFSEKINHLIEKTIHGTRWYGNISAVVCSCATLYKYLGGYTVQAGQEVQRQVERWLVEILFKLISHIWGKE